MTDSRGNVTTYTYDTLDRLTRSTYNSGKYTAYTWDEDGNRLSVNDYTAAGVPISGAGDVFTYDKLNRLSTETADGQPTVTETWDLNSRLATYDDGSGAGAAGYGYNDDGSLTSMIEPGGTCAGYAFPSPLPTVASRCIVFDVDKNGKRLRTVFPGNLTNQVQNYDTGGKITEITGTGQAGGVGTTLYDYTYRYVIGTTQTTHIVSRSELVGNVRVDYTYDVTGRLFTAKTYNTSAATGGTLTGQWLYCYDPNGNRNYTTTSTAVTVCPTTVPPLTAFDGANQTTGTGTAFDLSGDETAMPTAIPTAGTTRTATWSESQQLATTTVTGTTALASNYFGAGNQNLIGTGVSATDQDQIRNAPLGAAQVTRFVSGTETARMYTERDPTGRILVLRSTTGARYDVLSDNLASTMRLTADTTGNVVDSYSYDPYGTRTTTLNGFAQPFGYTSAYTNPGTGLIHLNARYYDPTTARFTQPDPAGQGPNNYTYAGDDPINRTDPSGLSFLGDTLSLAGDLVNTAASFAPPPFSYVAGAVGVGLGIAGDVVNGESTSTIVGNALVSAATTAVPFETAAAGLDGGLQTGVGLLYGGIGTGYGLAS